MNQIICTSHSNVKKLEESLDYTKTNKKKRFFKLQFLFLLTFSSFLIIYYTSTRFNIRNQERLSKSIAQSYRYY
jgi:hypothetical protein